MKTLGVKFSEKTDLQLKDVSAAVGMSQSQVARAAMNLGLKQLKSAAAINCSDAMSLIAIEDAKSKH